MAIEIDPRSYLLFAKLTNVDGVEFFDFPEFPEIFPQDDDISIEVGVGRFGEVVAGEETIRPDLLSYRIYNTAQLWWIIALRNNFEKMPTELKLGARIIAPSPRYVFQEILTQARG